MDPKARYPTWFGLLQRYVAPEWATFRPRTYWFLLLFVCIIRENVEFCYHLNDVYEVLVLSRILVTDVILALQQHLVVRIYKALRSRGRIERIRCGPNIQAVSYAVRFRASDLYFSISNLKAPAYAVRTC